MARKLFLKIIFPLYKVLESLFELTVPKAAIQRVFVVVLLLFNIA